MQNPFPGMNPYLERFWRSVHASMIVYGRDMLNEVLPEGLLAVVEERMYVELPDLSQRAVYPDIRVVRHKTVPEYHAPAAVATEPMRADYPIYVELLSEPITETYINIIETAGERVITTIEVLSLANKLPGTGQAQYLRKQQETIQAGINLVEIDLLRTGEWVLSLPDGYLHEPERTPYRVCVFRAERPTFREYYPIGLREPLPTIRVPLRPTDADAPMDLQALLNKVYLQGRYHLLIDYQQDPVPALSADDSQWVDTLLRKQGLRSA
ncbi:MAG: DUF4058 family protein [Fimbriimonadales bacterium]|nr:DUF4058 family protein [Fimbriimonadales bacterium]